MEIKTTTEITQEHKRFLSSVNEMPMNIYLNKANKKWVSVDSLKQVIYEYQQINDLDVGLDEMLIEKLENALTSNSANAKTNKDLEVSATPTPKVCPICKSNNLKLILKDGFRCLDCNSQGHLGKPSLNPDIKFNRRKN